MDRFGISSAERRLPRNLLLPRGERCSASRVGQVLEALFGEGLDIPRVSDAMGLHMSVRVLFLRLGHSSINPSHPDIILRLLLIHSRFGPRIGQSNEILKAFSLMTIDVVVLQILSLLALGLRNCRINHGR